MILKWMYWYLYVMRVLKPKNGRMLKLVCTECQFVSSVFLNSVFTKWDANLVKEMTVKQNVTQKREKVEWSNGIDQFDKEIK